MAKHKFQFKNWQKTLVQWGVLISLILVLTGVVKLGSEKPDPEAWCPMGGLEALATYAANTSRPGISGVESIQYGRLSRDIVVQEENRSKTTDVVYLRNGLPVESRSITIERAMVKWIRQIQGSLQVQFGKNIPENEILKVLLKQGSQLPKSYVNLIRKEIRERIEELVLELKERGKIYTKVKKY